MPDDILSRPHVLLPQGHEVAVLDVQPPAVMPENMDARLKAGESIPLNYTVGAKVTPQFAEWAKEQGIEYTVGMYDDGIRVFVETEDQLLWIKLRWT